MSDWLTDRQLDTLKILYEDVWILFMYVNMLVGMYVWDIFYTKIDVTCYVLVFLLYNEGGERGRRPPLPEIVRSSYRRLQ
jgi:hypothetical protein